MYAKAKALLVRGLQEGIDSASGVARRAQNKLRESDLGRFPAPRKLHLGCGTVRFTGWVNVDAERQPSVDLVWDLRAGIPGEDRTASFIYCEHFLEHLSDREGVSFLRECQRVLLPGGVLRIAMPSLDVILEKATSGRWREQEWLTWPEYQHVATRAEMLNLVFREWGHKWLYDREELERRLREVGLLETVFLELGESPHAELRERESRPDSLLICEATRSQG